MEGGGERDGKGLKTVANGLGLVWIGWILSPIATMGIAVVVRAWIRHGDPPPSVINPLVEVHGWCLMLGGLACSIGTQLCAAAPRAVAGKIYGAVACYILSIVPEVCDHLNVESRWLAGLRPFAALAVPVGGILFLLFLHDLADHLGLADLSERAAAILTNLMIAVAGFIISIFLACFPLINVLLPLAIGIYLLVTLVRYLGVLADMRRAIVDPPAPKPSALGQWKMPAAAKPPADTPVDPDDLELPP